MVLAYDRATVALEVHVLDVSCKVPLGDPVLGRTLRAPKAGYHNPIRVTALDTMSFLEVRKNRLLVRGNQGITAHSMLAIAIDLCGPTACNASRNRRRHCVSTLARATLPGGVCWALTIPGANRLGRVNTLGRRLAVVSRNRRQKFGISGAVADDTGRRWSRSVGRVAWPNGSTVGGPSPASCQRGKSAATSRPNGCRRRSLPGSQFLGVSGNTSKPREAGVG